MNNYPEEIRVILEVSALENRYDVKELVNLIGEYPISLKKNEERNKLIINTLRIVGIHKDIIKKNQNFDETFTFSSGVNVICTNGNNLQGKTSILKIINFMLTGNEKKLGNFISKTVNFFEMSLKVNNQEYIFQYDEKSFIIYENNEKKYFCEKNKAKDYLSKFFEEKFNYYPLNYVANYPNSTEFGERSFTWNSYFSTLYLDSKEYNVLFTNKNFGGLKNKIIGILFNLTYNQILNKIDTKQKIIKKELEKIKFVEDKVKMITEDMSTLQERLDKELEEFNEIDTEVRNEFNYEKEEIISLKKIYNEKKELYENILDEVEHLKKERIKKTKKLRYKKEEINLLKFIPIDLSCPNCFKEISDKAKKEAILKKKCYICGEEHEYIESLEVKDYTKIIEDEVSEIKLEEEKAKKIKKEVEKELRNIEKKYDQLKEDFESNELKFEELINKRSELKLRISEIKLKLNYLKEKENYKSSIVLSKEDKVLRDVISRLKAHIYNKSLTKLETFMKEFMSEAKKIGVTGLEDIIFNKSYEPLFKINGEYEQYESESISPGEQLRIKIAFYLTWLQISLKEKGYNHPAFLMIDSPGKEETNSEDLEELSSIFRNLDRKEEDFQIIIASAKNLPNASVKEKIKIFKGNLF